MRIESVEKLIFKLENDLLKSAIRKSSKEINEILATDFIEFCSSGSIYHYEVGETFQEQNNHNSLQWEIYDFKIKELSEECFLAMYKLVKHDELNPKKKYSIRSSIWKLYDGKWKMIFHQGTLTSQV